VFRQQLRQVETVRIGELLVKKELVTPTDLDRAVSTQRITGQKIGEILIQQGAIAPHRLQQILIEQKVKRWAATGLLALGASAGAAPQLVAQAPTAPPIKVQQTAMGGGNLASGSYQGLESSDRSSKRPTNPQPDFMQVQLASNPNPTSQSPLIGFCHPTAGKGFLSQGNNGITHRGRMAYAYDIATPIGTPLYAMRSGTVVGVRDKYPDTGGGRAQGAKFNYVWIEHDSNYRSVYIHLQQDFNTVMNLQKGDRIEAGQLIGYTGNSGWSTGPHLHIEVQKPKSLVASGFGKTVPFTVSGRCQSPAIASR
jgi:murein DD-endopeptidase MepM/ murein hydrolase activator NlpD